MSIDLRVATWNANGLSNHLQEVESFLQSNSIDIFLISETHFTKKSYFKIKGYDLIIANHPNERAHGGSAILIKSSIKYEPDEQYIKESIQAAIIKIKCNNQTVCVSAIYLPPRHNITCDDFTNFFKKLGPRFIVGGDLNAKHPWWGSRLINPKGRELYKSLTANKYSVLSTGKPTYWPSDPNKVPDLIDFFVYAGIPASQLGIMDNYDLSSDHSPIILSYHTSPAIINKNKKIITNKTDMESFSYWLDKNLNLNLPITSNFDLENAVEHLTNLVHEAAHLSTPSTNFADVQNNVQISSETRELIRIKRRLRKTWQLSRNPNDKRRLNQASKNLKFHLNNLKSKYIGEFFDNINTSKNNNYNLWKATKYLKRPTKRSPPFKDNNGMWCRSDENKAQAFAQYLFNNFQVHPISNPAEDEEISSSLDVPYQMSLPIRHFSPSEVKGEIKNLNPKKSPGYDNIDATVIKHFPKKAILFLTLIYNSVLRLGHFPSQWKCAEIIMIKKPNKPENEITSYRPISLLSIFSKIFEKIFLSRLSPILENLQIIPEHQFGFRQKHGTPEQCHRVIQVIRKSFEEKKYCSAVFLDIQQAFDRVWHIGILSKIKQLLPATFYSVIKSFLQNRIFYVKVADEKSNILDIRAGVPQGSVLSPVLYTIFTADMPILEHICVSTYADDTAILAADETPNNASRLVQSQLNLLELWLRKWKIKVNAEKSVNVTFTLRRGDCPNLYINNKEIPKKDCVKYLGMHLDRHLTWKEHLKAKRQHLNIQNRKLYWLIGHKSQLNIENKLKLYKSILKPVWTYGIQLWGTASHSNIEIIQRYQSKTLRLIVQAPWYITNEAIHNDLKIQTVKEVIRHYSEKYLTRLSNHVNPLAIALLDETDEIRRLKRYHILDLPFRS